MSTDAASNSTERDQRNFRSACIHEAAHVVIARHFKHEAFGWVYRSADPKRGGAWEGLTWIGDAMGARRQRLGGLAGEVAEILERIDSLSRIGGIEEPNQALRVDGVIRVLKRFGLNRLDAAAAGSYSDADVRFVVALLDRLWGRVEDNAADMRFAAVSLNGERPSIVHEIELLQAQCEHRNPPDDASPAL